MAKVSSRLYHSGALFILRSLPIHVSTLCSPRLGRLLWISSRHEFFTKTLQFYVEELKEQYGADRRVIKEILSDKKQSVKVGTTFDDLVSWVTTDDRGKAVDMGNMKLCYNSVSTSFVMMNMCIKLMEKAESDVREHEREQQRKRRRLESDLRNAIRTLVPALEPTSTWEEVRPKIEKEAAFGAVSLPESLSESSGVRLKRKPSESECSMSLSKVSRRRVVTITVARKRGRTRKRRITKMRYTFKILLCCRSLNRTEKFARRKGSITRIRKTRRRRVCAYACFADSLIEADDKKKKRNKVKKHSRSNSETSEKVGWSCCTNIHYRILLRRRNANKER